MRSGRTPPKVFISYSWSSPSHKQWVVELAERLSSDGVVVVLDKWDLKEGQDMYVFMEQMVTKPEISKVLVICDRSYKEKADARRGGVGTESMIISKEVYEKADQEKFIPVVKECDEAGKAFLPIVFAGRIFIDLSKEEGDAPEYERLLRNIFDRPESRRPPLGEPPAYLFEDEPLYLPAGNHLQRLKKAVQDGKLSSVSLLQDYFESLLASFNDFRLRSDDSTEPWDERVYDSIGKFLPVRDNYLELLDFASSHIREPYFLEELHDFLEEATAFLGPDQQTNRWRDQDFDNFVFLNNEMFLYAIAFLVKRKRYSEISELTDKDYAFKKRHREHIGSYIMFNGAASSLESQRNQRLGLNRRSITADLLKERATHERVGFIDLMQADAILFLWSMAQDTGSLWYPRTLFYTSDVRDFPLFAGVATRRGEKNLLEATGMKGKEHLVEVLTSERCRKAIRELDWQGFHRVKWRGFLDSLGIEQ